MTTPFLRFRPRRDPFEGTALLGLALFLGAWTMTYGAILLACGFLRSSARGSAGGLPSGADRFFRQGSLGVALLLLLVAGAFIWVRRAHAQARVRKESLMPVLIGTGLLACGGLAMQLLLLRHLALSGGGPGGSVRGSPYVAALLGWVGFHALHVAIGVGGLGWLWWRFSALPLRLWSLCWSFLAAAWWLALPLWMIR